MIAPIRCLKGLWTRLTKATRHRTTSVDVRTYLRAKFVEHFEEQGATTKQGIAETIGRQIPALSLYVPPARKPWMSEDARMGIFDAAALAWMFFHNGDGKR
jgi:hypothetical protein